MTGLETLQSVQYVTAKGKRLAVLNIDDWEALIEWLETLRETEIRITRMHALPSKTFGSDVMRSKPNMTPLL
jgi:hypothetical protein